MDINYAKNQITLYGKACKIDTLVKKLASLSGNQIYNFLINRTTQLPRKINCLALVSVLNNRIKFLHSNTMPKEEFMKLQYYEHFSELQLYNLFGKICNAEDFIEYRMNLMALILENYQNLSLNDGELMYLKNLGKERMEDFDTYFNYITGACLEQDDTFDGKEMDDLKANLQYSASKEEIYDIASRYGVTIPQRLKRDEYLDYIFDYLKRKGSYTEEVVNELVKMDITQISTYAKRTGINMQPNMSKQEVVTYLFYYLDMCEIATTSVYDITFSDKYKPLEFRVDLQAAESFGASENKKVIYYAGDHEDQEEMEAILADEKPEEVYEEIPVEEKPLEDSNAWKDLLVAKEEEKRLAEEAKEKARLQEEANRKAQEAEALLAEDIINEKLAGIEEKVEEIDEPTIDIDVKKVDINPELGTGKIEKLTQSKKKEIAVWVSLGLALAIIAFCVVGMLFL